MRKQDMADFKQSREVGNLTVKLDVDASDAIRALKALQREARKATQALRELEAVVAELKTLHKGEVVIPKELAEKIASAKPPVNITINVPEIKADDKADIEKIARELARKLDELND